MTGICEIDVNIQALPSEHSKGYQVRLSVEIVPSCLLILEILLNIID